MRQFIVPTYSPDGFGGGLASRLRDVVADAYSTIAHLAEASRKAPAMPVEEEGERYDDGLVHDHCWARSSTH
jgi:hypothetical protein